MKSRLRSLRVIAAALLAWTTMTPSFADDGEKVRKSMSREAQPSVERYVDEAEHPFIGMMKFYVPAQAANGTVAPVDYLNVDEVLVSTRQYAKPLRSRPSSPSRRRASTRSRRRHSAAARVAAHPA